MLIAAQWLCGLGKAKKRWLTSLSEFGQEGDAGGAEDSGELVDAFPVDRLEEGVGLKRHLLTRECARRVKAIAGQAAQALPKVRQHVRDGELSYVDDLADACLFRMRA